MNALVTVSTVAPINTQLSTPTRDLNRSHYRTQIRVDRIDDHTRFAYLNGQCHALASALAHKVGGTQIALVFAMEGGGEMLIHAYAIAPDRSWWDIDGRTNRKDALSAIKDIFDGVHVITINHTDAPKLAQRAFYGQVIGSDPRHLETPLLPANMTAARRIAEIVYAKENHPAGRG